MLWKCILYFWNKTALPCITHMETLNIYILNGFYNEAQWLDSTVDP